MVGYLTRYERSCSSLHATLSKLLTNCVLRPTQPRPLNGTRTKSVAIRWRLWTATAAAVSLLAALRLQLSISMGNGRPHSAMQYYQFMRIRWCHFWNCKILTITNHDVVSQVRLTIATTTTRTVTATAATITFDFCLTWLFFPNIPG